MFVPLVLPIQITAVLFLVALFAICLFAREARSASIALVLAVLLFIPSCLGIGFIVDALRYGQFEYKTAAEIKDPYLKIPPTATSVTVQKYASGHECRFTCEQEALLKYLDTVVDRRKQFANPEPFKRDQQNSDDTLRMMWDQDFGQRGWSMPNDVVRYQGWRSARGAGFDVWYSPSSQTGFISAGYW